MKCGRMFRSNQYDLILTTLKTFPVISPSRLSAKTLIPPKVLKFYLHNLQTRRLVLLSFDDRTVDGKIVVLNIFDDEVCNKIYGKTYNLVNLD